MARTIVFESANNVPVAWTADADCTMVGFLTIQGSGLITVDGALVYGSTLGQFGSPTQDLSYEKIILGSYPGFDAKIPVFKNQVIYLVPFQGSTCVALLYIEDLS